MCVWNNKRCMLIEFAQVESSEQQHLFSETKGCKSHFPPHSCHVERHSQAAPYEDQSLSGDIQVVN